MVAALFVQKGGVYWGLPDVDPWDEERDARNYPGPFPVVAHPPCQRWSKLAYVIQKTHGKRIGDDGGCFASALASVRRWGGVLEHPGPSAAWAHFKIRKPARSGWRPADTFGGWVCAVEQGHYGHPARKMTWLYAVGTSRPELAWGPSSGKMRCDWMNGLSGEREITPLPFRDLLLGLASSVACDFCKEPMRRHLPGGFCPTYPVFARFTRAYARGAAEATSTSPASPETWKGER